MYAGFSVHIHLYVYSYACIDGIRSVADRAFPLSAQDFPPIYKQNICYSINYGMSKEAYT